MSRQSVSTHDTRLFGRLRVLAAEHVAVCVQDSKEHRKILLVSFGRDGSIYVQFPYFRNSLGFIAKLDFADTGTIARNWELTKVSKVTSHLVKFAYHVDGEVHFSQDGRIRTEVRRKSFRLDGPIGHLFQASALGMDGFAAFTPRDSQKRRARISFSYPSGLPAGVNITGQWFRLSTLERLVHPNETGDVGPLVHMANPDGSGGFDVVLISPPASRAPRSHTIMLRCGAAELPTGYTEPMLVFVGGWDPHEVLTAADTVHHTGALLASYPIGELNEVVQRMQSVDLRPRLGRPNEPPHVCARASAQTHPPAPSV